MTRLGRASAKRDQHRKRAAPQSARRHRPDPNGPAQLQRRLGNRGTSAWLSKGAEVGAEQTTPSGGDACTPGPGIPPSQCAAYAANIWWLPSAYVNNATCACQQTPNVPTANCVRKFLQDRMVATPTWLKVLAASQKLNPAFVQAVLTPRIYQDHVDAYRQCCCPCGPAPYPAWIGVTTVPLPCSAVGAAIRQFGSCHCTPGSW